MKFSNDYTFNLGTHVAVSGGNGNGFLQKLFGIKAEKPASEEAGTGKVSAILHGTVTCEIDVNELTLLWEQNKESIHEMSKYIQGDFAKDVKTMIKVIGDSALDGVEYVKKIDKAVNED